MWRRATQRCKICVIRIFFPIGKRRLLKRYARFQCKQHNSSYIINKVTTLRFRHKAEEVVRRHCRACTAGVQHAVVAMNGPLSLARLAAKRCTCDDGGGSLYYNSFARHWKYVGGTAWQEEDGKPTLLGCLTSSMQSLSFAVHWSCFAHSRITRRPSVIRDF